MHEGTTQKMKPQLVILIYAKSNARNHILWIWHISLNAHLEKKNADMNQIYQVFLVLVEVNQILQHLLTIPIDLIIALNLDILQE